MQRQPVDRSARGRTSIASTLLAAASVLLAQTPALAASHGFPPAGTFDCDSASGIWQKLDLDENHDNLFGTFSPTTASPGQTVTLTLVWEWRDWKPGATLTIRRCLDVESGPAVDGKATAPFDALGGNPPDASVVHPVDEPTFTVMKETEVRSAVRMPFTLTVPATAPVGGEVCTRAAILADPANHLFSPPDYDISETVCVTVTAPPTPAPTPTPTPTPTPPSPTPPATPPAIGPTTAPPGEVIATNTAPAPPAVLGIQEGPRELPRTGMPFATLVLAGGLLLLAGAAIASSARKPSVVEEPTGTGPQDG
jgi:hypothetical protein